MNEQTMVGLETAQGKKRKEVISWRKSGSVDFLPGTEFRQAIRTFEDFLHREEELQKLLGMDVDRWSYDEDGEIEFVHVHITGDAWPELDNDLSDEQQYLWFNKEAGRFEIVDDLALWYALDQGFFSEGGLHEDQEDEIRKDNPPVMRFAQKIFGWVTNYRRLLDAAQKAQQAAAAKEQSEK